MITLDDVSVKSLVRYYDTPEIYDLIDRYDLRSIQDLLDIKEFFSKIDWTRINNRLPEIEKTMAFHNKRGKEPIFYKTYEYEDESLNYVDKLNCGNVLLLDNPLASSLITFNYVKSIPVHSIKKDLKSCIPEGENYALASYKRIGEKKLATIINAVDSYSNQVVKQAKLTDNRNINLFTYQQYEKMQLVKKKYFKIIKYLLNCEDKSSLSEFVSNNVGYDNYLVCRTINNSMAQHIANYMTLPELEDICNNKVKVKKKVGDNNGRI